MTLEEAIKHAEEKAKCGGGCGEDHAQLAEWLKELQKLRTVKTEKRNGKSAQNVSKEDLISRKAAIDALYDWSEHSMTDAEAWHIRQVIGDIKSLPPAEPNCSEIPNNSDCISRQAAITAIQKAYADTEGGTDKCAVWKNVGLTNALHIMQDLPSAQPEQHWIPCSERLPGHEYIDKCILISMAGETIVARVLDGINYGRGVWEFDNYSEAMGREAEFYPWKKIDAWMPLPAPYKEDTE